MPTLPKILTINPITVSIGDDTMNVCIECADSINRILFDDEQALPFSAEVVIYDAKRPLAIH
jgi:hypothetical protein